MLKGVLEERSPRQSLLLTPAVKEAGKCSPPMCPGRRDNGLLGPISFHLIHLETGLLKAICRTFMEKITQLY